ncbi:MAG TPA: 3-oxoacyl-ACP reductase FabG [Steroidobacteraceae bacterium]|nr:3-oxoacyl-ACP reductase FabG [Steroidobacteraceae bacterium]
MTGDLRRALVTGGSGGVGSAICRRLVKAGHHVYVHAHRAPPQAEALVEELRADGGRADSLCFDVTDAEASHAAIEQVLAAGPIQILVNNAGVHDDAIFPGMSALQWQRVIGVALQGFFNVTQPLVLPMLRTRWGRIISVSSVAAQIGNKGQVNYAAGKGALISATRALALEVATRGITVNAIAPGIIATRMSADSFDESSIARLVPMQRAGTAQEVASLAGFLVSDGAGYITGQTLSINGGMYLG